MTTVPKIVAFRSGVKKIRRSSQHLDLWIVSWPDGGWFALSSSSKELMESNPPTKDSIEYSL